jgi:hypothetical protein
MTTPQPDGPFAWALPNQEAHNPLLDSCTDPIATGDQQPVQAFLEKSHRTDVHSWDLRVLDIHTDIDERHALPPA